MITEQGIPTALLDMIAEQFPHITTFIETGTYLGETVAKVVNRFTRVLSVELSAELHARAAAMFAHHGNVSLYQGSSRVMLAKMLEDIGKSDAVIWLDAHYSCGNTALEGPDMNSPARQELEAVAAHAATGAQHVILIDDAEDFQGRVGFPHLHAAARIISTAYPKHVIRLYPNWRRGIMVAAPHWRG